MESQVRNHRTWVQDKSKELKSIKKTLRRLLNASRVNDFQLYEFLDANLSVMKAEIIFILMSLATRNPIPIRLAMKPM